MIKKEHDCFEVDYRTERHKKRSDLAGIDFRLGLGTSAGSNLLGHGKVI
jgi:hypothetical protein